MADWLEAQYLLSVYMDLSTSRPAGMNGLLPIPWHVTMWYADRLGLDHEAARNLWELIKDVDARYTREVNKALAPPPQTPKAGGNRRSVPQRTREPR